MTDNIKVAIKVRPLLDQEHLGSQWQIKGNTLTPIGDRFRDPFCFDYVFDTNATNLDVYNAVVQPITESALAGFNGTIFAYGQTASGKTYTLLGSKKCVGIIGLTIEHIFNSLEKYPDREFLLRASFIEIYQEKVFDLLDDNKNRSNIQIREDVNGAIILPIIEEVASTPNSLLNIMKKGNNNRKIGVTNMNERSSRSHTIFRIIIESRNHHDPDGAIQVAHLNLVDLAGSERLAATGATGDRLKEANHINLSLLSLSRVIKQLSEANCQNQFISYRDSKLTRILQSSLGGNAKTCIICTITPAFLEESHSTLSFAARAKVIVNKPELNEILSDAALINKYLKEMNKLKEELQKAQHVNLNLQTNEKKVTQTNQKLRERIALLENSLLRADKNDTILDNTARQLRRQTWCPSFGCTPQKGLLKEFTTPTLKPLFDTSSRSTITVDRITDDVMPLESFEMESMKIFGNVKFAEKNYKDFFSDAQLDMKSTEIEEEMKILKEFHKEEMDILLAENERCVTKMCAVQKENEKLKLELLKFQNLESTKTEKTFGFSGNFKLLNQSFKNIEKQIRNKIEILESKKYDKDYDINSEMITFLKEHLKEVKLNYSPCHSALKQLSNLKREMRQRLPDILETQCVAYNEEDEFELREIFTSVKTLLRQLTEHLVTSEWNLEQKEEHISTLQNEIEKAKFTINKLSERIKIFENQLTPKHQEIAKKKAKRSSLRNDDIEDIENTPIQRRLSDIQSNRRKLREVLQDNNRNIIVDNELSVCDKNLCENAKTVLICELEKQKEKIKKLELDLQNSIFENKNQETYVLQLEAYKKEHVKCKNLENENERLAHENSFLLTKLETLQERLKKLQHKELGNENMSCELERLKEQIIKMAQETGKQDVRLKELSQQIEEKDRIHKLLEDKNHDLNTDKDFQISLQNSELQIVLTNLKNQLMNKTELYESLSSEFNKLKEKYVLYEKTNNELENLQTDLKRELNNCTTEKHNLKLHITNLELQIKEKTLAEESLRSDINRLKEDYNKFNQVKFDLDDEIGSLKNKLNDISKENNHLKESYSICNKEKLVLEEKKCELLKELTEANDENNKFKIDIQTLKNEVKSKDEIYTVRMSEMKTLKDSYELYNLGLNNQLNDCTTENDNLKVLISNLQLQIENKTAKEESLRSDINKLKENHDKRNQLKLDLDEEIRSLINRLNDITKENNDLKENIKGFNREKIVLEEKISQLLEKLKEVNNENSKFKTKIETLENQIESKTLTEKSLHLDFNSLKEDHDKCNKIKFNLEDEIKNLNKKFNEITKENDILKENSNFYNKEKPFLEEKIVELLKKMEEINDENSSYKTDIESLRKEIDSKDKLHASIVKEINILKGNNEFGNLQEDLRKQLSHCTTENNDLKDHIGNLKLEIENKTIIEESLRSDINKLKEEHTKCNQFKLDMDDEVANLKNKLNDIIKENNDLKENIHVFNKEKVVFEEKISELIGKLKEINDENSKHKTEIQALENQVKSKILTEESLRLGINNLKEDLNKSNNINFNMDNEIKNLKHKLNDIIKENNDLKENINVFNKEKIIFEEKNSELTEKLKEVNENNNLKDHIANLKLELENKTLIEGSLRSDINKLIEEHDKCNQFKLALVDDVANLKSKLNDIIQENNDLKENINVFNKEKIIFEEKNNELIEKLKEINDENSKHKTEIQILENQIKSKILAEESLRLDINNLKEDLNKSNNINVNMDHEIKNLKHKLNDITKENGNLKENYNFYLKEKIVLQEKVNQLLNNMKDINHENSNYKADIECLKKEIDIKDNLYASLVSEMKMLKESSELNNFQSGLKKLSNNCITENDSTSNARLRIANLQQQIENKILMEESLRSDLNKLKQDHSKCNKIKLDLHDEITVLKEKLNYVTKENDNLKENRNVGNKEKNILDDKVSELLKKLKIVTDENSKCKIDIESLKSQIENKNKMYASLTTEMNKLKENLNSCDKDKNLEIIAAKVTEKQNYIHHLESQIEEKNNLYQALISENKKNVDNLKGLSFKLNQNDTEKLRLLNDFKTMKNQHDTLRVKNNALIAENNKKIDEIEKLNVQVNDLSIRLKELEKSTSHHSNGIKEQSDHYNVLINQLKEDRNKKSIEVEDLKFEILALKNELKRYKECKSMKDAVSLVDKSIQVYSGTPLEVCSGTVYQINLELENKQLRKKYDLTKDGYLRAKSKIAVLEEKISLLEKGVTQKAE